MIVLSGKKVTREQQSKRIAFLSADVKVGLSSSLRARETIVLITLIGQNRQTRIL